MTISCQNLMTASIPPFIAEKLLTFIMANSDKRIMLLLPAECFLGLVAPLVNKLRSAGATVRVLCAVPGPGPLTVPAIHEIWNWSDFFVGPVEAFNPTSILIWNGYAEHTISATKYLKARFNTAIIEMGWLPQAGNMYCLPDAAGVSPLRDVPFESGVLTAADRAAVATLKEKYSTHWGRPKGLPDKFIFVPMQLEHDTVIKHMSPDFKIMNKFLAYLLNLSPLPLVVKNHPKERDKERPRGVIMVEEFPASIYVKHADAVVGINSTVLTEAIVQHKRIVHYGDNVAEAVMINGRDYYSRVFGEIFDHELPSPEQFDFRIALLLRNQYAYHHPPDWIVQKVLDGRLGPRLFSDT